MHDAVVPRAKLPEVLERIGAICDRRGLRLANVFHAGDGNLHPNISFDRRDPDELARVLDAGREILETCVAAGGAISGEHGIGTEKRDFMCLAFDESDLEAQRRLRAAFDPDSYFTRIPSALSIKAIGEAVGEYEARRVGKLKKKEIAEFAIAHVAKAGWLPPELRTTHYDGPGAAAADKKAKAKALADAEAAEKKAGKGAAKKAKARG